jgi:outer membrane protein TolC
VLAAPDPERYHWNAGLNLDLPFERTAERNAYREALITAQQAGRDFTLLEDTIKRQVRDNWRVLEKDRRNYEISELTVKLSERRVEEEDLLSQLGRGLAKDQVDAQNDLINSKNQRTQAIIEHTIARLQFWNDLGILYIKPNGHWEEVQPASN